jgi:Mg2+ and Co2+ transporter CorA
MTIQVQVRKFKSFLVTCLYRPRFTLSYRGVRELEKLFVELDRSNLIFYCLGDFDIHLEKKDSPEIVRFNQIMSRNCLLELKQQPTRINACLDLAVKSDENAYGFKSQVVRELSDHDELWENLNLKALNQIL